jgi:hypothetical protein
VPNPVHYHTPLYPYPHENPESACTAIFATIASDSFGTVPNNIIPSLQNLETFDASAYNKEITKG